MKRERKLSEDEAPRLLAVKALDKYKIRVKYSDGESGVVNLAHLKGKGVFQRWDEKDRFTRVSMDDTGAISWGDDLQLCKDAVYLRLTGKKPEDIFPGLKETASA